MLPQPPPDAPAPPPSDAALLSRRKWRWIWSVGLFSIVALFVGMTRPIVIRSHRNSNQTEAASNARRIGLALDVFEAEFGKFPDASTVAAVRSKVGPALPQRSKSSNDLLRQLIAAGFLRDEKAFYAKISGSKRPDGKIVGAHALEKGECGFSYIAGLDPTGNPGRPILVTPLIPGTDRFDPACFDGMAIVLRMDSSVTILSIDSAGHAILFGENLLDPANPVWGKDKWTIAWPE